MQIDADFMGYPGQFPAQSCACGAKESRAGTPSVLESMGWQQINGAWMCPRCGGRVAMANEFWNPAHWSKPEVDENGEFRL